MSRKAKFIIGLSVAACVLAALAIPNIIRAYTTKCCNPCVNNLRLIESSKAQWALENGKTNGDSVTWKDLLPDLASGPDSREIPRCQDEGVYFLGKIGEHPRCSIGGEHTLPE
jgi:hypothetical protein